MRLDTDVDGVRHDDIEEDGLSNGALCNPHAFNCSQIRPIFNSLVQLIGLILKWLTLYALNSAACNKLLAKHVQIACQSRCSADAVSSLYH